MSLAMRMFVDYFGYVVFIEAIICKQLGAIPIY
jgi:hypothetical protein